MKSPKSVANGETSRVGAYLARLLGELGRELTEASARVASNKDDEDAVHDLRVAMRRVRTLLRLARPIYGRFHADVVRRAFADVMHASGDLRDEEVLEETLDELPVTDEVFAIWRRGRAARERRLRREMIRRVKSGELARAQTMLHALVVLPVDPERDMSLAKFARKVLARALNGVDARREAHSDDGEALHELRIAYKELRYTAELFTEALPPELAAIAAPAAKFQKRLGEVHDIDMALLTVAKARVLPVFTRTAALAALGVARQDRLAKYRAELDAQKTPASPPAAATPPDATRKVQSHRDSGGRTAVAARAIRPKTEAR